MKSLRTFAVLQWLMFGAMAHVGFAQELPPGGGPVPSVRRGANGQIEVVRPNVAAPAAGIRSRAAPAAPRASAPRADQNRPPRPVITVIPSIPRVPDTAPRGTVVATYSVKMSDGSPFAGTVRFGPPHFDGNGVFALSGNSIVVNPIGPGLGPNKATIIAHVTLEAITNPPHR